MRGNTNSNELTVGDKRETSVFFRPRFMFTSSDSTTHACISRERHVYTLLWQTWIANESPKETKRNHCAVELSINKQRNKSSSELKADTALEDFKYFLKIKKFYLNCQTCVLELITLPEGHSFPLYKVKDVRELPLTYFGSDVV